MAPIRSTGDSRTVSNPFLEDEGPQPPKVLRTPIEIAANLKLLQQGHTPLTIRFPERSHRFQSYIVAIDRERNLVALDELIPAEGERILLNGEPFHIEAFHDGVRIAWDCSAKVTASELDGARCYWSWLPVEMTYHQRRNAFRVPLRQGELMPVEIAGKKLREPAKGQLLDISATGCRLRFPGNLCERLNSGEVYELFRLSLPFNTIVTAIEARHIQYEENLDTTYVGARFHRLSGLDQRQIERFVYQLQREARRND